MARKPTDTVQLNLRFSEALRRRLEKEADRHGLSMNAEIIDRLEKSFFFKEEITDKMEKLMAATATSGAMEALKIVGWPAQGRSPAEAASGEHPAQDGPASPKEKGP
jgi:hypothetical protein